MALLNFVELHTKLNVHKSIIIYDKLWIKLENYIHEKSDLIKSFLEIIQCHENNKASTCHIESLLTTNNIKWKILTQLLQKYKLILTKKAKQILSLSKKKVVFQKLKHLNYIFFNILDFVYKY